MNKPYLLMAGSDYYIERFNTYKEAINAVDLIEHKELTSYGGISHIWKEYIINGLSYHWYKIENLGTTNETN